jgi:hypothetical protein
VKRAAIAAAWAALGLGGALAAFSQQATTPKKVLILGDSHTVTPFGPALDAALRAKYGPTVATYGVGATNIDWWAHRARHPVANGHYFFRGFNENAVPRDGWVAPPTIDQLRAVDWDIVIFALGANPDGPTMDYDVSAGMLLLTEFAKPAQCFWVGPPPMPVYGNHTDEFYRVWPEILKQGGRSCTLIDSRNFVSASQSVGSHYWGKVSSDWGKGVAAIIAP